MTLDDLQNGNMKYNRDNSIGNTVATVLQRAQAEKRLTCGMLPAIRMLELDPESILFCILPQNHHGDTALHIHYVLLEAFCYENEIHMVKVDCAEKLAEIVKETNNKNTTDYSCVLIHRPWSTKHEVGSEDKLLNFCSEAGEMAPQPIVELLVP